jgi:hypothetical protein
MKGMSAKQIEGSGRCHVLRMRARLANIAGTAQATAPLSLCVYSLNACPLSRQVGKLLRLFSPTCCLEGELPLGTGASPIVYTMF